MYQLLLQFKPWHHSVHQNNMKIQIIKNNSGFTIIETMVAVFVLTFALTGLLSLNASSLFSARYARNEITANYLLQEAADYFRNDRDTTAFLNNDPTLNDGWEIFLNKYGYNSGVSSGTCFDSIGSNYGCYIEFSDASPTAYFCNTSPAFGTLRCPTFNYDSLASNNTFYTYKVPTGYATTNFKRQILMQVNPARPDELDIQVKVEWLNGNLVRSRSLQTSLLNWQKQ